MRVVLLLPILLAAAASGAQEGPFVIGGVGKGKRPLRKEAPRSPTMTQVKTLKPNQRTDRARAALLARAYFEYHFGGCGAESEPIDAGTRWRFTTKVGDAASPGPDILVDKRTGTTSARRMPTVRDPKAYYGKPIDRPWWIDHLNP